jgi:hypothetical protein
VTPSSGSVPPAPAGFDEALAAFLAATLDLPPAAALPRRVARDQWADETTRLVAASGGRYELRREYREQRLSETLKATAAVVTPESLVATLSQRFEVADLTDFRTAGDSDICYLKINHGFWEQLYAIFAAPDPGRMRVRDPARFRGQYVASGFLDALAAVIAEVVIQEHERLRFAGVHFGVSLASGIHDHAEVIAGFGDRSPDKQKIVLGSAIGLLAWWETLFPAHRPTFVDGSFPKRGLATGALRETLAWAAARSERIVFVVPPHLAGIRLADAGIPQESILVPGDTVHESWAACLEATARHVLARLADDGSVLVITQSAVFSALLGLFLVHVRGQVVPSASRLRYFDLGQALDVAAPHAGGLWMRRRTTGDASVFHITPD